jgi:hypothetical protein
MSREGRFANNYLANGKSLVLDGKMQVMSVFFVFLGLVALAVAMRRGLLEPTATMASLVAEPRS